MVGKSRRLPQEQDVLVVLAKAPGGLNLRDLLRKLPQHSSEKIVRALRKLHDNNIVNFEIELQSNNHIKPRGRTIRRYYLNYENQPVQVFASTIEAPWQVNFAQLNKKR